MPGYNRKLFSNKRKSPYTYRGRARNSSCRDYELSKENLSPSELEAVQLGLSTSYTSSNDSRFESLESEETSANLQSYNDADSSPIPSESVSNGDLLPIPTKTESPPNLENPKELLIANAVKDEDPSSEYLAQFCSLKKEYLETDQALMSDDETNNSISYFKSSMNKMLISDDEDSCDGSQITGNICNDYANINEDVSEESQLLQGDPALRQFDVLDELEVSDQEEGEILDSNSEGFSESDEEVPIDDIDEMLDEGLPEKFKSSKNKECPIKLRKKVVLEEKGHNHFDLLPEGWMKIIHSSGIPIYLEKRSRVCTLTRPYYLGPGSVRNHDVPLSAVPCLHYRRASEMEKKNKEEREKKKELLGDKTQSEIELMSAEIETFEENKATQSLNPSELHEYCKKVFQFTTMSVIPFKSWSDRRKYVKMRKEVQRKQRPTLPGGTKLLKFPIRKPDGSISKSKGEWIINPNGKSYVCILHEYVQHALKRHPKYQFKEIENPATPYSATVYIEDISYGFGVGASKKHAKIEAAKAALDVLIPGMKDQIEPDDQFGSRPGTSKKSNDTGISIFDEIKVDDPRVAEFCTKTTEPPPYAILMTCLTRNSGGDKVQAEYALSTKSYKPDEFTMSVGQHKATVQCKNKREGKQKAAQCILKLLHPNVENWGSLLRMYGNRSIKDIKEKKQGEQEITQLQCKASLNQPNFAILEKLQTELLKLKDKRDHLQSKGKFFLPENTVLPSLSSTDLKKVNLSSNTSTSDK